MTIFGRAIIDPGWRLRKRLYYRLLGAPFAWAKPSLVLRAMDILPGDTALDVGCRGGEYVAEYAARGARALGVEINPSVIGSAIPRGNGNAVPRHLLTIGNAYHLPFHDACFTKVSICDCLEHLEHDREALTEIARVMRGGETCNYRSNNSRLSSTPSVFANDQTSA